VDQLSVEATVAGRTTLESTSIGSAGAALEEGAAAPLSSNTARHSGATDAGSATHWLRISSTSHAFGPRSGEFSVVATGRVYDESGAVSGEPICALSGG